jgi:acetyl esterase/lipase
MKKKFTLLLIALLALSLSCSFLTGSLTQPASPTEGAPSISTVYAYPSVTPLPTPQGYTVPSASQPTLHPPGGGTGLAKHTSKIDKDITYCTMDNVDLKLDLYFPKSLNGPTPIAVFVHGGGWSSGDKSAGAGALDFSALLDAGFIVGSVDYRLAPQYQFPAMIEDVKCAIRFLRANAGNYNINPDKIGVWGGSAGGHLVSMLGVTDSSAGFDVGQHLDQSSRVQAVVDMFGPADLTTGFSSAYVNLRSSVFGTFDLAKASPVTYITSEDPPFLILQGDADTTVPLSQSQEFYDKLTAAGVSAQLVIVHGGPHGLGSPNESPSRAELTNMIVQFFEAHLK